MVGFIRIQFFDWNELVSDSTPKTGHFDTNNGVLFVSKNGQNNDL